MAGDEEVPNPNVQATRAITIEAPPEAVWPWLVQMGYGRAGFYGYDLADNARMPSADRIIPELQQLKVGDRIPTGPDQGLTVKAMEPPRTLLLARSDPGLHQSVSLLLNRLGASRTRLVVRVRAWFGFRLRELLAFRVLEPGAFLLARKQLKGLTERAEEAWARQQEHPVKSGGRPS
jgi:hypothetical protein